MNREEQGALRRFVRIAAGILFLGLLCWVRRRETRLKIPYKKPAAEGPITGRVILVASRTARPEPRLQIAPNATPIFGVDVENLHPAQTAAIDSTIFGHP